MGQGPLVVDTGADGLEAMGAATWSAAFNASSTSSSSVAQTPGNSSTGLTNTLKCKFNAGRFSAQVGGSITVDFQAWRDTFGGSNPFVVHSVKTSLTSSDAGDGAALTGTDTRYSYTLAAPSNAAVEGAWEIDLRFSCPPFGPGGNVYVYDVRATVNLVIDDAYIPGVLQKPDVEARFARRGAQQTFAAALAGGSLVFLAPSAESPHPETLAAMFVPRPVARWRDCYEPLMGFYDPASLTLPTPSPPPDEASAALRPPMSLLPIPPHRPTPFLAPMMGAFDPTSLMAPEAVHAETFPPMASPLNLPPRRLYQQPLMDQASYEGLSGAGMADSEVLRQMSPDVPRREPLRPYQPPMEAPDPGRFVFGTNLTVLPIAPMAAPQPRAKPTQPPRMEERSLFWEQPDDTPVADLSQPIRPWPRLPAPEMDTFAELDVSNSRAEPPTMDQPPMRGRRLPAASMEPVDRGVFSPPLFRDAQIIGWWNPLAEPARRPARLPSPPLAAELQGETLDLALAMPSDWAPPLSSPGRAPKRNLEMAGEAIAHDLGGEIIQPPPSMGQPHPHRPPPLAVAGFGGPPEFVDIAAQAAPLAAIDAPSRRGASPRQAGDQSPVFPHPAPLVNVDYVAAIMPPWSLPGRRPAAAQAAAADLTHDGLRAAPAPMEPMSLAPAALPRRPLAGSERLQPPELIDVAAQSAPLRTIDAPLRKPLLRPIASLPGAELTGAIPAPLINVDYVAAAIEVPAPRRSAVRGLMTGGELVPAGLQAAPAPIAGMASPQRLAAPRSTDDFAGGQTPRETPSLPPAAMDIPARSVEHRPQTPLDFFASPQNFQILAGLDSIGAPPVRPHSRRQQPPAGALEIDQQYFAVPDAAAFAGDWPLPPGRRGESVAWQPFESLVATGDSAAFVGVGQVLVAATELWILSPVAARIEISQRGPQKS